MPFGVLYSNENEDIYKNSYMLILSMFPQVTFKKAEVLSSDISLQRRFKECNLFPTLSSRKDGGSISYMPY